MDDYMTKPIKRDIIAAMLARWLPSSAAVAKPEEGAPQAGLTDGGLAEVIQTYLEDTPAQFRTMDAALPHGDYVSLERSAHSLKSSSLAVGAATLAQIAAALETHARERGSLDKVRRMCAALGAAFTVLAPQLQARAAAASSASERRAPGADAKFVKQVRSG